MKQEEFERLISVTAPGTRVFPQAFTTRDAILFFYWSSHPRYVFFKTVPHRAKLLDIGAGDGGIVFWKSWNDPERQDIVLHVNDLTKGEHFEKSEQALVCDLTATPLDGLAGAYDAVMASHVLEHIHDWDAFIGCLSSLLSQGGTLYLEWPSQESMTFPPQQYFLDAGIPVSTVNFHDDSTHLKTATHDILRKHLRKQGFAVQCGGHIRNRFLGEELLSRGRSEQDCELCTYGIWLYSGFSQYLIASKPSTE